MIVCVCHGWFGNIIKPWSELKTLQKNFDAIACKWLWLLRSLTPMGLFPPVPFTLLSSASANRKEDDFGGNNKILYIHSFQKARDFFGIYRKFKVFIEFNSLCI